ncbi:MAG: two-component regulator propeller domain-containing protein [Segetibacter sp.]
MKQDFFRWVNSIQETAKQELVFTVRDGFVIINKEGLQQYLKVPVPADKTIIYQPCLLLPLLKEYPDEIWVGACFNGLYKYSLSQNKWTHFTSVDEQLNSDYILGVTRWNSNEWLLGYFNLCFFNHRTGVFTKAFDDKIINNISSICYDNDRNLWLASNTGGLNLLDLNISKPLFSSSQSIAGWRKNRLIYYDNDLQTLYSINPFYTNSIHTWNPAANITGRDTIPYFPQHLKTVNDFIADNNNLYFAMYKGMCRFNLNTHQLDSLVYTDNFSNSQNWCFSDVCKSQKNIYFANGEGRAGPFAYHKATHSLTDLSIIHR